MHAVTLTQTKPDRELRKLITTKFVVKGKNVSPQAVEVLASRLGRPSGLNGLDPEDVVERVCASSESFVISPEDVIEVLDGLKLREKAERAEQAKTESLENAPRTLARTGTGTGIEIESDQSDYDQGVVKVLRNYVDAASKGNVSDFVAYFRSRYEKLSRILKGRLNSQPLPISLVWKRSKSGWGWGDGWKRSGWKRSGWNGNKVDVIGMVADVRETSSGNVLIELEDLTGRMAVIVSGDLRKQARELLGDEVIGVAGVLRNNYLIAENIVFPEIPVVKKVVKKEIGTGKKEEMGVGMEKVEKEKGKKIDWKKTGKEKEKKKTSCKHGIAFISDTHFGSETFMEDAWNRFVSWMNCEIGNEKSQQLAEKVRYVVVAGDIVDGIGVYPGQEKELTITDIYQQYEEAAAQFDRLPKDIKIIVSPGNHDAVRQAEPQPPLPEEYANLFSSNVVHVSNPAMVELAGVKVLVYHGRSLDELVLRIPRLSYSSPAEAMVEYLRRRTFAPGFGSKSIHVAPLDEDMLVIDDVPDVLHCGHVHTYGVANYRGVLLVNSSTFQAQTEYQKKMNFNPEPGNVAVAVYDGKVRRLRFCA